MPIYRFHIESPMMPEMVIERMKALTKSPPRQLIPYRNEINPTSDRAAIFLGIVDHSTFHVRRNINYKNSFLPFINGTVAEMSLERGSEIRVTMFMHPIVALFTVIWLSITGHDAWITFQSVDVSTAEILVSLGMFVFGIALALGGSIPEVIKSKRLLSSEFGAPSDA